MLFPVFREELQGVVLDRFSLFSEQFSVNFPDEISRTNPLKSLLKGPSRPISLFKGHGLALDVWHVFNMFFARLHKDEQ